MDGVELDNHSGRESDTDSDDEDYVPLSGEDSEGVSACEQEANESEIVCGKKKKGKKSSVRKSTDDVDGKCVVDTSQRTEEEEKKHADSLWADFLKDVEPPKKKVVQPTSTSASITKIQTSCESSSSSTKAPAENPKKVTITQVFDFAGESVTVTKEVDVDSKEAKNYSDKLAIEKTTVEESKSSMSDKVSGSPEQGFKRPAGIGNVLDKIMNKKQKINTLDKSLLDWNSFKKEEGIEDDLNQFNKGKGGYLDKIAFLQRADLRQFDLERNLRMTNRSKR